MDHLISPENTGYYIDKYNVSFEELENVLPDAMVDSKEKHVIAKEKEKDKDDMKAFVASKLRSVVKCDSCGLPQCIYTHKGDKSRLT